MSQGNAARNTSSSMDDILSSIRQIIAETEDRARSQPSGPSVPPANDSQMLSANLKVDASKPPPLEAAADNSPPPAQISSHDKKPVDDGVVKDVLSRLDAEISQNAQSSVETTPQVQVKQETKYASRFSEEDSRAFATVGDVLNERAGADITATAAPVVEEPAIEEPAAEEDAGPLTLTGELDQSLTPIISEQASLSVTKSFQQLEALFASKDLPPVGETVEQLLKPMLQDWLDNNLPTVVERLVRAEIERVARGEPRQA